MLCFPLASKGRSRSVLSIGQNSSGVAHGAKPVLRQRSRCRSRGGCRGGLGGVRGVDGLTSRVFHHLSRRRLAWGIGDPTSCDTRWFRFYKLRGLHWKRLVTWLAMHPVSRSQVRWGLPASNQAVSRGRKKRNERFVCAGVGCPAEYGAEYGLAPILAPDRVFPFDGLPADGPSPAFFRRAAGI